jgi:hypothetical protein
MMPKKEKLELQHSLLWQRFKITLKVGRKKELSKTKVTAQLHFSVLGVVPISFSEAASTISDHSSE